MALVVVMVVVVVVVVVPIKYISPLVRRPPVPYAKQMTQKSEVEVVDLFMVDPASNAGKAKHQKWFGNGLIMPLTCNQVKHEKSKCCLL